MKAILGILLFSPFVFAELLFFQISDTHANYKNIPSFLTEIIKRTDVFKKKFPKGEVVYFFNGDLGGFSQWSGEDLGFLDYEVLRVLASRGHVGASLGNHEGFDFNGISTQPANEVFYQQNKKIIKAISSLPNQNDFKILAANMIPTKEGDRIFAPYQDIHLNHQVLRIIGLTLKTFFQESTYSSSANRKLFSNFTVEEYLSTLIKEYRKAQEHGIHYVIFQIHDNGEIVKSVLEQFLNWQKTIKGKFPRVLLAGSGHTHKNYSENVSGIPVIEAGSDYSFAEIQFPLHLQHCEKMPSINFFHPPDVLEKVDIPFYAQEIELIERAQQIFEKERIEGSKLILDKRKLQLPDEPLNKKDFVGKVLTNMLRDWAIRELERHQSELIEKEINIKDVYALYNSLSFGWDEKIEPLFNSNSSFNYSDLKGLIHFVGRPRLIVVEGKTLLQMSEALTIYGAKSSRPFKTPYTNDTFVSNSIENNALYAVALDHWTAQNGYKIPAINLAFTKIRWELGTRPLNLEIANTLFANHVKYQCALSLVKTVYRSPL